MKKGLWGAFALLLAWGIPANAKPDAVSAASLTVTADSVKATSARISYSNDRYNYGSRTLCYNPAPASPTMNCVTKTASGNEGFFNITGLTPSTLYNYSIKAINTRDTKDPPYTSGDSFTTLAGPIGIAPSGLRTQPLSPGAKPEYDLRGRKNDGRKKASDGALIQGPASGKKAGAAPSSEAP